MSLKAKMFLFLFILAVAPLSLYAQAADERGYFNPGPGWTLEWSDEFDGDTVDTNKWTFETGTLGGGNAELQYYTDTNAFISNGKPVHPDIPGQERFSVLQNIHRGQIFVHLRQNRVAHQDAGGQRNVAGILDAGHQQILGQLAAVRRSRYRRDARRRPERRSGRFRIGTLV